MEYEARVDLNSLTTLPGLGNSLQKAQILLSGNEYQPRSISNIHITLELPSKEKPRHEPRKVFLYSYEQQFKRGAAELFTRSS